MNIWNAFYKLEKQFQIFKNEEIFKRRKILVRELIWAIGSKLPLE